MTRPLSLAPPSGMLTAMKTLGDIGELGLIRRLRARPSDGRGVVVGIGDDCAVVRPDARARWDWVLKSDPVIEGVHFLPRTPGVAVGHKAVGRVLSDMAAMGADPRWALIDVVAPAALALARLLDVYRGARRLAARYGMAIVGGDVSRGRTLELHVFGGGVVPRGLAVRRSTARPGDLIYVTGRLGGSLAGRHLRFQPRVAEGCWLREHGWATAMIDLSDGLASDLRHMTEESGVGATVDVACVPVSAQARRMRGPKTAAEHALFDGEDFELLFTVRPGRQDSFERAWRRAFRLPCTRIGAITRQRGAIECRGADGECRRLTRRGYEHFRQG